jgi:hypothetical protein
MKLAKLWFGLRRTASPALAFLTARVFDMAYLKQNGEVLQNLPIIQELGIGFPLVVLLSADRARVQSTGSLRLKELAVPVPMAPYSCKIL